MMLISSIKSIPLAEVMFVFASDIMHLLHSPDDPNRPMKGSKLTVQINAVNTSVKSKVRTTCPIDHDRFDILIRR